MPNAESNPSSTLDAAMRRALELARRGPAVGPNPQVGCVLMDSRGDIVAEGWHRGAGTPHAEVAALYDARARGVDTRGLTAVVTLEPCNHTGRTGPCSEALLAAGIGAVHYAVADPGDASSGGAARLAAAGVPATHGPRTGEGEALLHPWLTAVRRGRPWVIVKWASTLDGRAAAADGSSQWITGTTARQRVHEERAAADAILVGTGTVLADDPSLTARGDGGELLAHQPLPVVVGERRIPSTAKLHAHPAGLLETGTRDPHAVLRQLHEREIRRVYVEGGPTLASALIAAGLADEYSIYLAPALLGGDRLALGDLGIPTIGDARRLHLTTVEQLGDDLFISATPKEH